MSESAPVIEVGQKWQNKLSFQREPDVVVLVSPQIVDMNDWRGRHFTVSRSFLLKWYSLVQEAAAPTEEVATPELKPDPEVTELPGSDLQNSYVNEIWPELSLRPGEEYIYRGVEISSAEFIATPASEEVKRKHAHYFKDVRHLDEIDVYRVLDLWQITDPAITHAVKKLLVPGGRGAGKTAEKDVQEAIDSLVRWQVMQAENGAKR